MFSPPFAHAPRYGKLVQAVEMANANDYGLAATLWSENPRTLIRTAKKLDAGTVWMNTNVRSRIEAPYGGNKNSGMGREYSIIGLKEYLKVKNNILFIGEEYDNPYGFKDAPRR